MPKTEIMPRRKTIVAAQAQLWLVVQNGAMEGRVLTVRHQHTIGTSSDADLRLDGYPGLALLHARLVWHGTWLLSNGESPATLIDGRELLPDETRELLDGVNVHLGTARLIVRIQPC